MENRQPEGKKGTPQDRKKPGTNKKEDNPLRPTESKDQISKKADKGTGAKEPCNTKTEVPQGISMKAQAGKKQNRSTESTVEKQISGSNRSSGCHEPSPKKSKCATKRTYRKCYACEYFGLTRPSKASCKSLKTKKPSTDHESISSRSVSNSSDLRENCDTSSVDTSSVSSSQKQKRKHKIVEFSEVFFEKMCQLNPKKNTDQSNSSSDESDKKPRPIRRFRNKIHSMPPNYSDDSNRGENSSSLDSDYFLAKTNNSPVTESGCTESSPEEVESRRPKRRKHFSVHPEIRKSFRGTRLDSDTSSSYMDSADSSTSNTGRKSVLKHLQNFQTFVKTSYEKIKRWGLFVKKGEKTSDSSDSGYNADRESDVSDIEKASRINKEGPSKAQCSPSKRSQDDVEASPTGVLMDWDTDNKDSDESLDSEEEADPFENVDLEKLKLVLKHTSWCITAAIADMTSGMWDGFFEEEEEQ